MIPQKEISFMNCHQIHEPTPTNPTVKTPHCTDYYTTECVKQPHHKIKIKLWEVRANWVGLVPSVEQPNVQPKFPLLNISFSGNSQIFLNLHVALHYHNIQRMCCHNNEQILPILKSLNRLFPLPCSLFCILQWHHLFWLNHYIGLNQRKRKNSRRINVSVIFFSNFAVKHSYVLMSQPNQEVNYYKKLVNRNICPWWW